MAAKKRINSFYQEFKNFAIKGNMIDMAVGIIIGTAFNNIVSTIVKSVIMPPLSLMTEGVKLSNKKYVLRPKSAESEEVAIGYGELIEVMIDFVIIAFTIFMMVKLIHSIRKKEEKIEAEEVVAETPKDIQLLSNIEKLLEQQNQLLKNGKKPT